VCVINAYGPTEATVAATYYICPRPCGLPMLIGGPNPNMHCYVVEPGTSNLLPRGTPGELLLSGPRLAVGYVGRPELTEQAFVPNPFYSEVSGTRVQVQRLSLDGIICSLRTEIGTRVCVVLGVGCERGLGSSCY
jgi:non-ribosomal peptide synthetase component F